jgi:hypothetical protein
MTRATRGNPSPTSLTSESPHLPSRASTRNGRCRAAPLRPVWSSPSRTHLKRCCAAFASPCTLAPGVQSLARRIADARLWHRGAAVSLDAALRRWTGEGCLSLWMACGRGGSLKARRVLVCAGCSRRHRRKRTCFSARACWRRSASCLECRQLILKVAHLVSS